MLDAFASTFTKTKKDAPQSSVIDKSHLSDGKADLFLHNSNMCMVRPDFVVVSLEL